MSTSCYMAIKPHSIFCVHLRILSIIQGKQASMSLYSNLGCSTYMVIYQYIYIYNTYRHAPAHEMSDLTTFDRRVTRIYTYPYLYLHKLDVSNILSYILLYT